MNGGLVYLSAGVRPTCVGWEPLVGERRNPAVFTHAADAIIAPAKKKRTRDDENDDDENNTTVPWCVVHTYCMICCCCDDEIYCNMYNI